MALHVIYMILIQALAHLTMKPVVSAAEKCDHRAHSVKETSQELRMLSSVTIDCQITRIVMDSGSQLSELLSVSQRSQLSGIAP